MSDWWESRSWRQIQTNLREIDMLDIDAERVVADMRDFSANVLMINAAGIIASYPTQLPFHFQSPFLKGDSLQEIIAACHRADIRVNARTDFSKVRRPIYEQYPEWAYVSRKGEVVDYNGDVAVCINGEYQQKYALEIIRELLESHDFDGIFFNMGGFQTRDYSGNYYGPCHCANCQRRFGEMFGLELPAAEEMGNPVFRKYAAFKDRCLREHHEKVESFIRQLRPDICIANHRESRRGFIRQESNTAIERPLPHWQYSASDNTRWATSSFPQMVSSNTTVDFIDFPYRHAAVSPEQQRLRLAQNLANGGSLDFYLIGRLDNHEDRSGFAGVKEIFGYHAANEAQYADLRSCADVALLNGPHANQGEFRGWFRTLVENHFLFDTLMTEVALELPLEKYRALVAPDLQAVSDELAARIDRFVEGGGLLIASGRSGFRDEESELRSQPGFDCLGIERVKRVRTDARSSYLKWGDGEERWGSAETDLVFLDGPYVYADYGAAAQLHMKLIPPHNFGPPERCYYELVTDHPGFSVHPFGKGKAVYVPWLPGSLFHRQGYANTGDFCAVLLEEVAGVAPVGGELSPMVEVTLFEKGDGSDRLLHLVNGSGHFGTSFFAPVPMADLEVTVPCAQTPASVRTLRRGEECDFDWVDGALTVRILRLGLFEAIAIEAEAVG